MDHAAPDSVGEDRTMRNIAVMAAGVMALSLALASAPAQAATPCVQLTALRFPDLRVIKTTEVRPEPAWMSPLAQPPGGLSLPVRKPFCRVEGTIEDEIG
ncbi:MAG: hypothetical protein ACKOPO_15180, partial [Novosphingobium sp.]